MGSMCRQAWWIGPAVLLLCASGARAQTGDFDGWRLMPVRSQGEFERGEPGGRAEQYLQGAARCQADPGVVYLSHDCGETWRSRDGGRTWAKPLNLGLYLPMGQSIEVDPVDCERVVLVVDSAYDWRNPDFAGIYRSEDGGDHWTFVLAGPSLHSRRYEHDVAWAPSSVDAQGARRWYVALYTSADQPDASSAGVYVSDDRGASFTRGASLVGHDPVYELRVSPADEDRLLVATSQGLFLSGDGGQSLGPVAGLPAGEATSVAFDPTQALRIWAVVRGGAAPGLYRSEDGGDSFTRQSAADAGPQAVLDDARRLFVHPRDGQVLYVLPQESSDGRTALRSADGGASFALTSISLPDDVRAWRWGLAFAGDFAFLLPSASDPQDVVGQSLGAALYRSSDGLAFVNGSTLFDGANCGLANRGVAFDPGDPERFALGNADIGVYLTENGADWFVDRGVPWEWVGDRVSWSSQHTLDISPADPAALIGVAGGVFDKKLVRSPDSGLTWEIVDDVVNYHWRVAFHPLDPGVIYAGHRRSLDGGASFQALPIPAELDDDQTQVIDYCRADPDVLFTASRATGRILRSEDRGDTWALWATAGGSLAPFDPIMTTAVDPADCDVVYALDAEGDLARFDGARWESLGALAHAPGPAGYFNYVRSVAVDPRHAEILYVGLSGCGGPAVLRSLDAGQTWEDVSYNLFRQGVSQIDVSPHTGEVLVGGCSGTRVLPPPYASELGLYDKLVSLPSCFDGLRNGGEGGVDCGGACRLRCPEEDGRDGDDGGVDGGADAADEVDADGSDGSVEADGSDRPDDSGGGSLDGSCGCAAGGDPWVASWIGLMWIACALRRVGRFR
jgi:hypothetical protein